MLQYSVNFEELNLQIKKMGFKKIMLQLPEGLTTQAIELADKFREFEVYISTKPTYGACDIETHPGMLTLHFGHSPIPNINYPDNIVFVEFFSDADFEGVLEKFISEVNCKRVGLVASVQHVKKLPEAKAFLEAHGIQAVFEKGDSRITHPGQVLGCNFSTARNVAKNVDCFAFLGTGAFHALGVRLSTDKKTYALDPYSNNIEDMDKLADRFVRQRFGAIVRAQDAESFGIIISTKIGQRRLALARSLRQMIEDAGKKAYFLLTDTVVPEKFYYPVDAFVNTACPRITYDDYMRFNKPILSPVELQIALNYRIWENFRFDEIVEVD